MLYLGKNNNVKSILFLFFQFGTLTAIFLTGKNFPGSSVLLSFMLLGIFLGVWAIIAMGSGNLNVPPDVMEHARLVTRGPYNIIRHPMYTAILLVVVPIIIYDYNLLRIILMGVLVVDLVLKMNYEEKSLQQKFPEYESYCRKTWRIIPYLY